MSKVQRERLDAQLRGTGVGYEQSVGESRENFAKLMNALPVPEGIRVYETSLGGRPALRISPDAGADSGTLLYLHGGSHVVGSPRTALGLTAGLVVRTGQVGTNEMLLDDVRRLAVRASDAEVNVVLDITAKVPHVFQSFAGVLDEADGALDRAALFLRQRVRG